MSLGFPAVGAIVSRWMGVSERGMAEHSHSAIPITPYKADAPGIEFEIGSQSCYVLNTQYSVPSELSRPACTPCSERAAIMDLGTRCC